MSTQKLLLILVLLSIIPGQIIRIPISAAVITVSDIAVFFSVVAATIYLLAVKKSVKLNPTIIVPTLIFSTIATASTVLSLNVFNQVQVVTSSLFLVRFLLYFLLSVVVANIVEKKDIKKWQDIFLLVALAFAFFGFFQLAVFPDLSSLVEYGWDPHQQRLVSTLIDPNFSGGLMAMALAISTTLFLATNQKRYLLATVILFLAIILTFSRSSYLALATTLTVIGILKSPKLLSVFLFLAVISFLFIPQVKTRVEGAFSLDDTSQARIQSWQKAIVIFQNNPILGVGFNTYRYAQESYGFFENTDPTGGHSGGGSDSSLLLVLATTGISGAFFYIHMLFGILKIALSKMKKSYLHLAILAAFASLLIHSQFVNSFFFPQIMLVFWFLVGLIQVE